MKTWQKLKNNHNLWGRYLLREQVIKKIRSFFDGLGFHEVETPILLGHPAAESYLDVFETKLLNRHRDPTPAYLSTSPEVALKKLLVAGIGNCYCITKSFRNTEVGDALHNPEFTILEWYRVGATYTNIMDDCEELILHTLNAGQQGLALNTRTLSYQGNHIDLAPPWERISVSDAFQKFAHIDLQKFFDLKNARVVAASKGYSVTNKNSWEELYNQIFLNEVEPRIGKNKPVFLYDFPSSVGALAKTKIDDPRFVERFELYIAGLEIADCYTELTDWKEQRDRFNRELIRIKKMGKTSYDYDYDFIEALKVGLPPCAGIALGVDRLLVLLTNSVSVDDVMFFPIKELL